MSDETAIYQLARVIAAKAILEAFSKTLTAATDEAIADAQTAYEVLRVAIGLERR